MRNKQNSSVDILIEKLITHAFSNFEYGEDHHTEILILTKELELLFEQAKEMHKQEIIAAKDDNYVYGEAWEKLGTLGEQYYNETFGE